jgi:hypothetical protein
MQELLGEVQTDIVAGMTSSNSVTSEALQPPMLSRSPATPMMATARGLHIHASSQLGGTRSSLLALRFLQAGIMPLAIDLSHTPALSTLPRQSGSDLGTLLPA